MDAASLALSRGWIPLSRPGEAGGEPAGAPQSRDEPGAGRAPGESAAPAPAEIEVTRAPAQELAEVETAPGEPALEVEGVALWIAGDRALARGERSRAAIDLEGRRADVAIDPGDDESARGRAELEAFWLLSLSTALLLGRLGIALVHAGAVCPGTEAAPRSRATAARSAAAPAALLVGGSGSGKTTACANLLRAGWNLLADDHIALARGERGEIRAYGFPRPLGIDAGWPDGKPTGQKRRLDPRELAPAGLIPDAPIGALYLPTVTTEEQTSVQTISPAHALGALLRQSPWLTLDKTTAPAILDLLHQTCRAPAAHLHLGPDTFTHAPPIRGQDLPP